jgi:hypothetical protein
MTGDPHDHDRTDGKPEPEQPEPEPEDEPEDEPAHHRPGIPDQLASLRVASAVLAGDDEAAHEAAGAGTCGQCTTIAGVSFALMAGEQLAAALVARLAPGAEFDAGPYRAAILDLIAETERDLRSMGN